MFRGVIVALAFAAAAAPAGAQTLDDLFNRTELQEVRLWVHSNDLRTLKERIGENTYFPADFEWRGIRIRNVGIRNRGTGSRNPIKLGLRVEFDHYASGQNLLGLKTIILRNLWQDKSLLHEDLAMAFFARMGQPASRESFARVYINNVYSGVYGLVENVDQEFLQRTGGTSDGYLFEFRAINSDLYYGTDLGDDLAVYRIRFEPEAPHKNDSDAVLYTPIRNLLLEANRPVDEAWRGAVDRYLDLGQFVTHLALENFVAENDGFVGYAGMNNFYLFRQGSSDQHRVIFWDKSETFFLPEYPIFVRVEENVIATAALSFSDLRDQYLQVLVDAALSAAEAETPGGPGWLEREVIRQSELIREAVYADTFKQFSNEEFEQEVENLKRFARDRSAYVLAAVARRRTP